MGANTRLRAGRLLRSLLLVYVLALFMVISRAVEDMGADVEMFIEVDGSTQRDAALVELELLETQTELLKMKLELLE